MDQWIVKSNILGNTIHIDFGILSLVQFTNIFQFLCENAGVPTPSSSVSHHHEKRLSQKVFAPSTSFPPLNSVPDGVQVSKFFYFHEITDTFKIAGFPIILLRVDQHRLLSSPSQEMLTSGLYIVENTLSFEIATQDGNALFLLTESKRSKNLKRLDVAPQYRSLTMKTFRLAPDTIARWLAALLKITQTSFFPITTMETTAVKKCYAELTGTTKFIGLQPEAYRHTKAGCEVDRHSPGFALLWSITPKLDGQRYLLFCCDLGQYLLSQKLDVVKINDTAASPPSLFDCELMGTTIHIFDCFYSFGVKVMDFRLADRLAEIGARVEALDLPNTYEARVKPYYTNADVFHMEKYYLECLGRSNCDGVMFVHNGKMSKASPPLKYKPDITIDFMVKKRSVDTPRGRRTVLDFYVGADHGPKLFERKTSTVFEKRGTVIDGEIYECSFDAAKNQFKIIRARSDKKKPNYYKVALDNFELMCRPEVPFTK